MADLDDILRETYEAAMTDHPPMQDKQILAEAGKQQAGHFDICREMSRQSKDIRMSLLENVTNLSYSKRTKGTTVTIGIDGNLVGAIFNNQFVGGLLLCDREQYFAMADELDRSIPSPIGEERESAKEFEAWARALTADKPFDLTRCSNSSCGPKFIHYESDATNGAWSAWRSASRPIAALQQRFDSLIERVNAASSMEEIGAILNDYEAENAELRKRMREK